MRKLLIVTEKESVLSDLLKNSFACCDVITPEHVLDTDLDSYDIFAVLGGTTREGITLLPPMRKALDAQIFKGKKFFAEFVHGIGQTSFLETKSTRYARPVLINPHEITGDLQAGVILDEQSNDRLFVYKATNREKPILQYVPNPRGFYNVPDVSKIENKLENYALWLEGYNLLISAFRLCNFSQAKFSPRPVWAQVVSGIVNWLGGKTTVDAVMAEFDKAYTLSGPDTTIAQAADRALDWYQNADMLVNIGGTPYTVKEGLTADVHADGSHVVNTTIRNDCTGETALAFFLRSLWKKSEKDLAIADGLYRMPLDMVITEDCPHKGMMRGSIEGWWQVSYSDCRGFVLPMLFRQLLTGNKEHEPEVRMALNYLVSTSGTDGLRCMRFDFYDQFSDEVEAIGGQSETVTNEDGTTVVRWHWGGGISGTRPMSEFSKLPVGYPSVHYNGYSLAAMLFGYKLTGDKRYLETGVKGIETIMSVYPFTAREHSETQEYCRFILPLAMLYWVSDEPEHKEWLYRVAKDLQRFRHPKGGYIEWDTGYTAACAGVKDGESSVLCENGDPIMDLLYSLNWLPLGFAMAYYVTKDPWFKELWQDICQFLAGIQIRSDNKMIDGAWPRAFDAELREVYGVPNDVGWAPWSVETGWTMGPISIGMILGLMEDEIKPLFDAIK